MHAWHLDGNIRRSERANPEMYIDAKWKMKTKR
jgi:hypothetical protein